MKMTMEQKELVVQNLDLVNEVIYYRVKRNPGNPNHDLEDLEQIGRLGPQQQNDILSFVRMITKWKDT